MNGLLECLDGEAKREGVVVVGATNHPEKIDEALRRPGRLDKLVEIPLPDDAAREGILRFHLRGLLDGVDLNPIVSRTEGMAGAWLESLVRDAKRLARRQRRSIEISDLLNALPKRAAVPADVLARLAVHEAGHAIVALEQKREIKKAQVEREFLVDANKQSGGFVLVKFTDGEQICRTKSQVLNTVVYLLSGLAAEEVFFGERSDGGTSDLKQATACLARMYLSSGQADYLSYLSEADSDKVLVALHRFPDLRREVEQELQSCMRKAKAIITQRKHMVSKLAEALVMHGTISGEEINGLFSQKDRRIRLLKSMQLNDLDGYSEYEFDPETAYFPPHPVDPDVQELLDGLKELQEAPNDFDEIRKVFAEFNEELTAKSAADIHEDAPLKIEDAIYLPELNGHYSIDLTQRIASDSISVKTLRKAISDGHLTVLRPNTKNMYITRRAIREWLNNCLDLGNPRNLNSEKNAEMSRDVSRTRQRITSTTTENSSALDAAQMILEELKNSSKTI